MNGTEPPDWLFYLPLLCIGGWVAISIAYRRSAGKPVFPRQPSGAIYKESQASGWNDGSWIGRIGGANRCLLLAVTDRELVVTPFFPFNLMFLPEIYGLEVRVPLTRIRRVEDRRRLFRNAVIVDLGDGKRFGLILRDPVGFKRALERRA